MIIGVHRFWSNRIGGILFLVFGFLRSVHADSVQLAWDANSEPDVEGYKVYYGTNSRYYEWSIDVGDTTEYTVQNLHVGIQYFFAVTAYDTIFNESDYSEEVTTVVGGEYIITDLLPVDYSIDYLEVGDQYYLDYSFVLEDIPGPYENLMWIKTKIADKMNDNVNISFEAGVTIRVYVAHDSRVTPPAWLSDNFTRTEDALQVSDEDNTDFRLWSSNRTYSPCETVQLGPNGSDTFSSSMYVVLIQDVGQENTVNSVIRNESEDVVLSWDAVPQAESYSVFRSNNPYFTPENPLATVADLQYSDFGQAADSVSNKFWVIKANRTAPLAPLFTRMGKIIIMLQPGLNLVSLPLLPEGESLTEVFGEILTGGSNARESDRILKWNGLGYEIGWMVGGTGTQWDGMWFNKAGSAISDMTVRPDEGFWVDIRPGHPAVQLTVFGNFSPDTARVLTLQQGLNLIGVSYPITMTLCESELFVDGAASGATNSAQADRIFSWNGSAYEIAWLMDNSGTEFDGRWLNAAGTDTTTLQLEPGKGYWLHIRQWHEPGEWSVPNPDPDL